MRLNWTVRWTLGDAGLWLQIGLLVSLGVVPEHAHARDANATSPGEQNVNQIPRLSRRFRLYVRRERLPTPSPSRVLPTMVMTSLSSPSPAVFSNVTGGPDAKEDELEQSSSTDKQAFLAWPIGRRPTNRKFRPLRASSTTRSPFLVAKLLRPRPSRPAMYSLDGFVPRPSIKKIFSSAASQEEHKGTKTFGGKSDLQALGSVQKKRKVKFRNDASEPPAVPEGRKKFQGRDQHRKKRPVTRHNAFARRGVPGKDYPLFSRVPDTTFDCGGLSGTFADGQAGCQVWHLCPGGGTPHRHSFLCPNGTIFSEAKGICDWWYNVDCDTELKLPLSVIAEQYRISTADVK